MLYVVVDYGIFHIGEFTHATILDELRFFETTKLFWGLHGNLKYRIKQGDGIPRL